MQPWREHPQLQGKFHPEYPDDIQVLVHEGGPRVTNVQPELMWVRVNSQEGEVFAGELLNQPNALPTLRLGDQIKFILAGLDYPLRVTDEYLASRPNWTIARCSCGFTELFDTPETLSRICFPNAPGGAILEAFSNFCPVCGVPRLIHRKGAFDESEDGPTEPPAASRAPRKRKWWQFWRR